VEGLKGLRRQRVVPIAPSLAGSRRDPVTITPREPRAHGAVDRRIVADDQYAAHGGLPPLYFPQKPATPASPS
jgi:hypothetical protein